MSAELIVWLVVLVPLIVIEAIAVFHVAARRPDLSTLRKGGWIAGILLVPYVGILMYALLRQPTPASGKAASAEGAGAATTMGRVRELIDAHASGAIDDEEFTAVKREIFGL